MYEEDLETLIDVRNGAYNAILEEVVKETVKVTDRVEAS